MQDTKRLYYTDSYLRSARAEVVRKSDDGLRVILDQTSFYPTSGGQPNDTGAINGIPVVDVLDEDGEVVHVLSAPLHDSQVEAEILWERRYEHMQQHTGQHLLSAVFEELFKIPTLSFRMGDQVSTIELGAKEISAQQIEAVTLRGTELARSNPQIIIRFENAEDAQNLRKASAREGTLRIIEIPGIDKSACGGTHVAGLAEVLPLQIRDLEKVRGNVRISFVCGNRAIGRARKDFELLSRVSAMLATAPENVETQLANLKQALVDSEKQRLRLSVQSGLDLYAMTPASADGVRRVALSENAIDENVRSKAKSLATQAKAVALFHSSQGLLLACSSDSGYNAGVVLKQALAKFGGRGGGSVNLAQGSLTDPGVLEEVAKLLGINTLGERPVR